MSSARKTATRSFPTVVNQIGRIHVESAEKLRRGINEAGLTGRWDIGNLLNELMERGVLPSSYGDSEMTALAEELRQKYGRGFSARSLYYMHKFATTYSRRQLNFTLNWTMYRLLMTIESDRRREYYEKKVVRERLTADGLENLLRQEKEPEVDYIRKRLARPYGRLYTYQVRRELGGFDSSQPILDLGFGIYHVEPVKLAGTAALDGAIVGVQKTSQGYEGIETEEFEHRFLYRAQISRVVDGDTFIAYIDLGFKLVIRQRLRLRCVDAPELGEEKGEAVMRYVEKRLGSTGIVLLKTHATDKYDRYLSDILYLPGSTNAEEILEHGTYLNRELVERDNALFAFR